MQWLLMGILTYLAGCFLLCLYMLAKLLLGRRMSVLVGEERLRVTRPPFRIVASRHTQPVDRASVLRRTRRAA